MKKSGFDKRTLRNCLQLAVACLLMGMTPFVYRMADPGSAWHTYLMVRIRLPPAILVKREIQQSMRAGDWTRARKLARRAERRWPQGDMFGSDQPTEIVQREMEIAQGVRAKLTVTPSPEAASILANWEIKIASGCAYAGHRVIDLKEVGNYLMLWQFCSYGNETESIYSRRASSTTLVSFRTVPNYVHHNGSDVISLCDGGNRPFAAFFHGRDNLDNYQFLDILQSRKVFYGADGAEAGIVPVSFPRKTPSICNGTYAFRAARRLVGLPYKIVDEESSAMGFLLYDPMRRIVVSTGVISGDEYVDQVLARPGGFSFDGYSLSGQDADSCKCPDGCNKCREFQDEAIPGSPVRSLWTDSLRIWWNAVYEKTTGRLEKRLDMKHTWETLPQGLRRNFKNRGELEHAFGIDEIHQQVEQYFYTKVTLANGSVLYCAGPYYALPRDLDSCWPKRLDQKTRERSSPVQTLVNTYDPAAPASQDEKGVHGYCSGCQ